MKNKANKPTLSNSNNVTPPSIEALLQAIRALPGDKIITLAIGGGSQAFDITAEGAIGYTPAHELLCKQLLTKALTLQGGLVIRQFLPLKTEKVMPNGKKMWIPKKNVYGVVLGKGTWMPLPAEEVRLACSTDADTGASMEAEESVYYRDFPFA